MSNFSRFHSFLRQCNPNDFREESHSKMELLIPEFSNSNMRTYYAPFDHINKDAELVLVGITPGRTQMNTGLQAAALALQSGLSPEKALERAKTAASFSGSMRDTLVKLLDHAGLNSRLGVSSSASVWEPGHPSNYLIHFTSALRNPVFIMKNDVETNYTGSSPALAKYPGFVTQRAQLCDELRSINPKSLILPLGTKVAEALQVMVDSGAIALSRVLNAQGRVAEFPHPSGANAESANLVCVSDVLTRQDYCESMYREYLSNSKKNTDRKPLSKSAYVSTRAKRWDTSRHTRLALSQLA